MQQLDTVVVQHLAGELATKRTLQVIMIQVDIQILNCRGLVMSFCSRQTAVLADRHILNFSDISDTDHKLLRIAE